MVALLDKVFYKDSPVTVIGYDTDHDGSQLVEVCWDTDGVHHKLLVKPEELIIK